MSNFIEELIANLGPQVSEQLTSQLGIGKDQASGLLGQVAPMVLGGLKRQMENHGGEARVDHILGKYADASVLDDIGGFFRGGVTEHAPDPGLGGLLGNAGHQATDQFASQLGINKGTAAKLIPILAPIILGALMKHKQKGFGSAQGGAGIGGIAGLLDRDGDGSVLDDVVGMIFNQGGGGGQAQQGAFGGSLLGKILSGLLGGNKR